MLNDKCLIILPGWGGSHETWQDFVEYNQKDYGSIHVIDLPCFGKQPCPNSAWGKDEYTEFVKKEIQKISHEGKVLLGHSFGGQIAANLAAKNPDIVDKLILSGAAAIRPKKIMKRIAFGILTKLGKLFFKLPIAKKFNNFARKLLYKALDARDYNEANGIKREIFKKIIREDLSDLLPKIKIPTLVLWGEKDSYVPLRYGKKIFKLIPNSKMHIFKKGRHGLYKFNKEEMSLFIKEFLSND